MKQYVNGLSEGERFESVVVVRSKEMRIARTGDPYLALEFADRTGQIPGVYFRPPREAADVPVGTVCSVRGRVTAYRGSRRVSVDLLMPAEEWDSEDLMARGVRPEEELVSELKALVASVREPGLRRVLRAVFGDEGFFRTFRRCPGSQSYHHAYVGGLLEHTVTVAGLCSGLAERYPLIDRDLLVTAALLHDIGKCNELAFHTDTTYTDEGRLLGHVVLGARRLHEAGARARAPIARETLMQLEHAMLSHHGELEWGSPKRPSTLEALLLHHADNLDAKVSGFSALLSGASRVDETWTDAANLFRRPLYAPRALDDDRPTRPLEDVEHSRLSA